MGSQIFILPYLDSIGGIHGSFRSRHGAGFVVHDVQPTIVILRASGAVFYLINMQEFARQTSLSVARDRVAGVLLGLFMMWLVFDQLWGARAGLEMKRAFIATLRLLAQLVREPASGDMRGAIKGSNAVRETINANFDKVRSFADGVLFEFGRSRQEDLALRDHIRRWQPQLRTIFLMQIAALKYRLQLPGFELPEAVRVSLQTYDESSAQMLENVADQMEGKTSQGETVSADSLALLERTLELCRTDESRLLLSEHGATFVPLLA